MRILVNDIAVFECARLRFIGVADQINRLFLIRLDKAPFYPARKTCSTAPAQAGGFDLVYELFGRHRDGIAQLLVTIVAQVAVDVRGPFFSANVFENEPVFEWMN